MSSKHLCNFIAILNLGVRTKKKSIRVTLKTNYLKLLVDLLLKENLIYGYVLKKTGRSYDGVDEEEVIINFKVNLISKIELLSSPSHKRSVTVYELNSLFYKNRTTIYILSTSLMGFSTSLECLKNNTGGLLVCGVKLERTA